MSQRFTGVRQRREALLILLVFMSFAVLVTRSQETATPALPIEFRFSTHDLNDLPVKITDMASCGCWVGPQGQAERKYKFKVFNGSSDVINIGGDASSQIRLLVAYPKSPPESVEQPLANGRQMSVANPSDVPIDEATSLTQVKVNRLTVDSSQLAIPIGWSLVGIPPNPNGVALLNEGAHVGGFPTYVDETTLRSHQEYADTRLGHGDWVFEIPLPPQLRQPGDPYGAEMVFPRKKYSSYIDFVGVAVFGADGSLEGFAPAPSDDELATPSDL